MVRIKHRYLLVHILYPDPAADDDPTATNKPPPTTAPPPQQQQPLPLPALVQIHRPSPADLTPQLLARAIRDQVLLLYGDYGLGLVSGSLNGV